MAGATASNLEIESFSPLVEKEVAVDPIATQPMMANWLRWWRLSETESADDITGKFIFSTIKGGDKLKIKASSVAFFIAHEMRDKRKKFTGRVCWEAAEEGD